MGNNSAYSSYEAIVVGLYDIGVLTSEALDVIVEAFEDQDADAGGYEGKLSKGGKDLYQIFIETKGREYPKKPDIPQDWNNCSDEETSAYFKWQDSVSELCNELGCM